MKSGANVQPFLMKCGNLAELITFAGPAKQNI
jgi:hypothetical protein